MNLDSDHGAVVSSGGRRGLVAALISVTLLAYGCTPASTPASVNGADAGGTERPVDRSATVPEPSGERPEPEERPNPAPEPETSVLDRDHLYSWLWAEPGSVRMVWRDDEDAPLHQLQRGRRALEENGDRVVAITNGGIHEPGLIPLGLYVEEGLQLVALNRREGSGNFFTQPNGVFWVAGGVAGATVTADFEQFYETDSSDLGATAQAALANGSQVDYAVQSGPMLVIDGEVNPRFSPGSASVHTRNAVAVDATGRVLLILARQPVNLWQLAERCRELGAVNALYLDGSLSRLEAPLVDQPIFPNVPVASMIAVVVPPD